jgi:predicted MFS family arabinose efflux permease
MDQSVAEETQAQIAVERHPPGGWPAVASVAMVSFALVFSEFLPIGLLPDISGDLGVSIGTAGAVVVAPAITAAVAAPLVTIACGRLDRRRVLIALAITIGSSNLLAAIAPNFAVMASARILLGIGVGGFWAMGSGLGVRLVASHAVPRASSLITAGVSAATVTSLPLGSLIGQLAGWRTAFVGAAVLSLLALGALVVLLPPLPSANPIHIRTLISSVRRPAMRFAMLGTGLVFFAHFVAYTYITPYLENEAHFAPSDVTLVLLGYGLAGLVGNFAAGAAIGRSLRKTYITAALLLAAAVLSLNFVAGSPPAVIAFVALWGLAFGALPLAIQIWTMRSVPDAPEAGLALLVSANQTSTAVGSFVGGLLVDNLGLSIAFGVTAELALIGAFIPHREQ